MIDFRLGRWQDVLADVGEVDAVITDPPYGARTHKGQVDGAAHRRATMAGKFADLSYQAWGKAEVDQFVDGMLPRCRGWFGALTSHDLILHWQDAFERHGRYAFAPVVWLDKQPRSTSDGPASWACYLMLCRKRTRGDFLPGYRVGAYLPGQKDRHHIGGKPRWLMRAIIRDYTKPGDLVCDPCAGGATTLIAAAMEGRRAIGCEMDPDTFAKAQKRIAEGYTPDLFTGID